MVGGFILIGMTYLIVKHYVVDFTRLQTPWMYLNKGKYGHPGGLVHSLLQAVMSAPLFLWAVTQSDGYALATWYKLAQLQMVGVLILLEFLVHYHMDWFKVWLQTKKGWLPHTSPHYWSLLGVDQMVHHLTYVTMLAIWVA